MRRSFGAVGAIMAAVSITSCISDDDDVKSALSEAVAYLSVDSAYFWIPVDSTDTTWVWNRASAGIWEHEWTIDVPSDKPGVTLHFSFVRVSNGGGETHGPFREMAADANSYCWSTDEGGSRIQPPMAIGTLNVRSNGVYLTPWQAVAEVMYPTIEPPGSHAKPFRLTRRSVGREPRTEAVRVEYRADDAQLLARDVDGPLRADEYVIYHIVFSRYDHRRSGRVLVESPSIGDEPFDERQFQNIRVLGASQETVRNFLAAGADRVDFAAMAQMGYQFVVADQKPRPPGVYVTASKIGFGRKGTEAMVYVVFSCGNLCGEGVVFHLNKSNGYWIVQNSTMIWIS